MEMRVDYDMVQFVEQNLGVQLLSYQKAMLKMLEQTEKIYYVPCAHCGINEIRRYKDGQN